MKPKLLSQRSSAQKTLFFIGCCVASLVFTISSVGRYVPGDSLIGVPQQCDDLTPTKQKKILDMVVRFKASGMKKEELIPAALHVFYEDTQLGCVLEMIHFVYGEGRITKD